MARIKVIEYESASGRLKDIYDDLIAKRGRLAQVHTIQSLRPDSIVRHMDLYLEIMFTRSELSRSQREMIAVIVSVENGCSYCQAHHSEALNHYWKDSGRIESLKKDIEAAQLNETDLALCQFASHLTLFPADHESEDFTQPLREHGFSDEAILDLVLVVAYFNFVNRIVLSLGLLPSEAEIRNYNY